MGDIKLIVGAEGRKVVADFRRATDEMSMRTARRLRHFAQLAETRVKANASTGFHAPGEPHIPGTGPGPNVATSDYLRSINLEQHQIGRYTFEAIIGTDQVRGPRLEFGFEGTDSAGREVHAKPYPHFGPAISWVEPLFAEGMARLGEI